MSIPYSMVADAVDAAEVRTGNRNEGLYFGLYTFAYKLGTSVSLVASGFVLHIVGFDPDLLTQTQSTQFNLAMVPVYLLLAISPIALLCLGRYRIDRIRHADIRAELDQRGISP